jgi:O-antigen ligase
MITESNEKTNKRMIFKSLFIPFILGLLLLFFTPAEIDYTFSININAIYVGEFIVIILAVAIGLIIVSSKGVVKFDIVAGFLLLRMVYSTLIVLAFSDSENLANYLATILAFFSYFYFLNCKKLDYRIFTVWIKVLYWILILQTLMVVIRLLMFGQSMFGFKSLIQIPVGGSNAIATYIVMFLPILYKQENIKGVKKIIYMLSAFLTVLFTRSTTGFICLALIILVMLLQEHQYRILKMIIIFAGMLGVVYVISYFSSDYLTRLLDNINGILRNPTESYNNVSNGRTAIWQKCIELWESNPLFGIGFSYRTYTPQEAMAHNWILEALVSGGIISALLLVSAFINISKKLMQDIKWNKTKNYVFMYVLLGVLVQGLFEPSIGTFRFDTILWAILGFAMSLCRKDYYSVNLGTLEV